MTKSEAQLERERKEKADIVQKATNCFNRYRTQWNLGQWNYLRMARSAQYFLANQDIRQYLNKWDRSVLDKGERDDQAALQVDNLKIMYHMVSTLIANLSNQEFELEVRRKDKNSFANRTQLNTQLEIAMLLKKAGVMVESMLGELGLGVDELPVDKYALERYIEDYRLADEIDLKYAIQDFLDSHNFTASMLPELRLHMVLFGYANLVLDPMSKRRKMRISNPYYRMSSYCQRSDCSDVQFECEIMMVPLNELKVEAEGQIEDWNSIENIATSYVDFFNTYNSLVLNSGAQMNVWRGGIYPLLESERVVAVLHYVEKKVDELTFNRRVCKDGIERTFVGLNDKGANIKKPIENVQTFKWIIGTNEVYQSGNLNPRLTSGGPLFDNDPSTDFYTCHLGFVGFRVGSLDGRNIAIAEKGIDIINQMQQLWVKMDKQIKRILPAIIKVDRRGFAETVIGTGNNGQVSGFDVAKSVLGDGVAVYDSRSYGNLSNNIPRDAPITVTNTEEMQKLTQMFDAFAALKNELREFMNVPPQANGVLPGTRTGNAVSELVLDQAAQTLKPIYDATENIFSRFCQQVGIFLKYTGHYGVYKSRPFQVDPEKVKFNIYDFKVRTVATRERWERIYQMIERMLDQGMLSPSVALDIEDTTDVREARLKLKVAEKESAEIARQEAEFNMAQNQESQMMMTQAQTEGKIAVETAKAQAKGQADMAVQQQRGEDAVVLEGAKTQGKIDVIRLEDDQMDKIANKVVSLLKESSKEE